MTERIVKPARRLRGTIAVPGDKSISHRAAMLNALADGEATVHNFLAGEDCLSTLGVLRELGVESRLDESGDTPVLWIRGVGLRGLVEPTAVLDCGNSGTTMRLMSGILAGQPFLSVLSGDASLRTRPMARVAAPLREMGARIDGRDDGRFAPLAIRGGGLHGIRYRMPVASAQVKSSILLAGLFAEGETIVEEPEATRDHTERMLAAMGARIGREGPAVRLTPGAAAGAAFDARAERHLGRGVLDGRRGGPSRCGDASHGRRHEPDAHGRHRCAAGDGRGPEHRGGAPGRRASRSPTSSSARRGCGARALTASRC